MIVAHTQNTDKPHHFFRVKYKNNLLEAEGENKYIFNHRFCNDKETGWFFDGKTVIVQNDQYGFCPLYYHASSDVFIVSNSIPCLLCHIDKDFSLDWEALACFFNLGWFIGEDTPFIGIKAMLPNSKLDWNSGKLSIQSTPMSFNPIVMKADAAVDEFYSLFSKSISNCITDKPFGLPLSGGADSRLILAELCRQGNSPKETITVGAQNAPNDSDSYIAGVISKKLGIPNTLLSVDQRHSFKRQITKTLNTNYCALEHEWAVPIVNYSKEKYDAIYDGIGCDIFLNPYSLRKPHWIDLLNCNKIDEIAEAILAYFSERQHISEDIVKLIPEYNKGSVLERISVELKKYLSFPRPVDSFLFFNRTRRCISMIPMGMYSSFSEVHCPYLDRYLMDWVINVKIDDHPQTDIRREAYCRYFPEYANVPFATNEQKQRRKNTIFTMYGAMYNLIESILFVAKADPSLVPLWLKKTIQSKHLDKRNLLHFMLLKKAGND